MRGSPILVYYIEDALTGLKIEYVEESAIAPVLNGESGYHIYHVRILTELILREWCTYKSDSGLSETDIEAIAVASSLHDIGKMQIPQSILNYPGTLSPLEYDIVKKHSAFGEKIIRDAQPGDVDGKIVEYSTYINALAYRDSLTGIKNSTAYTEVIEALDKEINLSNPEFGVLVADINNLKKTNDTYGHDVGNELIIHTAKILTDTFKTSSTYRIGGDEFVVILRGKDLERHRALIERMDSTFSDDYVTVHDESVSVSIARGVAVFSADIDRVYTDVFAKADQAMYMNKESMKLVRS